MFSIKVDTRNLQQSKAQNNDNKIGWNYLAAILHNTQVIK